VLHPWTRNWIALARLLRARRSHPRPARDRRLLRHRPWLETLEDRTVPATFLVNNPSDSPSSVPGTLREAILLANSNPGADTIEFDSLVGSTITLVGEQLPRITESLTIGGPGADRLTIDAQGRSRIFQIWFNLTVQISGLTLTGGAAVAGGAIYNLGTLTVTGCNLHHNSAGPGGAINNDGALTVIDSTLYDNSAEAGGGIYNFGTLTLI
jgi:hypothetical protein